MHISRGQTTSPRTFYPHKFNFSSPSYFTRYMQKYLGSNPTDFREWPNLRLPHPEQGTAKIRNNQKQIHESDMEQQMTFDYLCKTI